MIEVPMDWVISFSFGFLIRVSTGFVICHHDELGTPHGLVLIR